MNILVIAPHPDDETIGCGGTLCHHAARGDHISVVFLTSGELGLKQLPREKAWAIRESEARNAAGILKLGDVTFLRCSDWMLGNEIPKAACLLRPLLETKRPRIVYLPHPQDAHPDHQAALPVLRAALKGHPQKPDLRLYEVWTPLTKYDLVQDISSFMARKMRALRVHKSQLQDFDYVRAVSGLNQFRGALAAKSKFAEVFAQISVRKR
jgi:LmbE family N-acetylglucosaminyl deacetylase